MSEYGHAPHGQERAPDSKNARQFIGWMFKDASPETIAAIPDSRLPVIFNIMAENATQRLAGLKDRRQKKRMLAPISLMKRWADGQSFGQIYHETGKNEGSVRIALMAYAERLGAIENFDELLSNAEARAQAMAAAADQANMQPVDHAPQLQPVPELVPEPADAQLEETSRQAPNGEHGFTRKDLVEFLLRAARELPPLEEYPLLPLAAEPLLSYPREAEPPQISNQEQSPEEYPLMAKLEHTEKLDQMLRDSGVI